MRPSFSDIGAQMLGQCYEYRATLMGFKVLAIPSLGASQYSVQNFVFAGTMDITSQFG